MLKLLPLLTLLVALFSPPAVAEDQTSRWIDIEVGKSYIHHETRELARILLSDSEIAELKSLRPGQFQVRGLQTGSTDLWIWYSDDQEHPVAYQVTVHQDLSDLVRRVDQTVDGTPPRAYPMAGHLVIEGPVANVETLERVANIAKVFDPEFVNLMTVAGDHQVQLKVVFAEVSRTGMRALGLNAGLLSDELWSGLFNPAATTTLTGGPKQKPYSFNVLKGTDSNNLNGIQGNAMAVASDTFSLMGVVGLDAYSIFGVLNALEETGLTKVLAQPTLVALSGQQAEFLAGGEVPLAIIVQDNIGFEFKDYGIKLVFVPTVLGDEVIDLRVYSEVSQIDDASSIQLGSIGIPGFITRKASSHLRLQSGMTFAMAGLMSESVAITTSKVPILGEIPLVGALFRSTSHQREERELMILVTPQLVRPMAADEIPPPPGATEDNNPNDFELFLMGLDHRAGSRTAEPTGPIGVER